MYMIDFQSGRKDKLFFRNLMQSQYFLKGGLNFFKNMASYYKTLKKCYCQTGGNGLECWPAIELKFFLL